MKATQDPNAELGIATELQNPEIQDARYVPQSNACDTLDTIVPLGMRYEMLKAIERVDRQVNGVDEYVAKKLGYYPSNCSKDEKIEGMRCLCSAFSAEQVDALAVIINNIETKGHATIIGDMTGIGKGRIAAGIIRYGVSIGAPTIFLTEKPNLFSDLFRDIIAIGSDDAVPMYRIQKEKREKKVRVTKKEIESAIKADIESGDFDEEGFNPDEIFKKDSADRLHTLVEIYQEKYFDEEIVLVDDYKKNKYYATDILHKRQLQPFIVNGSGAKTDIKDEEGNIIYEGLPNKDTKRIIESGKVPSDFKFILATYSQFTSSKETLKKTFLRNVSGNAIIVMDESHNASGSSNSGLFLMDVLRNTIGACFLSATWAKRPDNMPIYASKTAISDANMTPVQLVQGILAGGVALQEILSSQLVLEGEMIRRDRSYKGIEVDYITLDASQEALGFPNLNKAIEHSAISDAATGILRDIIAFQIDYVEPEIAEMDNILKAENAEVEQRKGTQEAGISNSPVFSGVFQIINQLLFSTKAEALADVAISDLKAGRKPIVAFSNTMESFLNSMTNDDGSAVEVSDRVPTDFSHIFLRRLKSVLKYTVTSYKEIEVTPDVFEYKPVKEYLFINPMDMSITFQNEYNRILDKIKNTTVGISSSPIDVIVQKIEAAGFTTAEVTGRDRSLQFIDKHTAIIKQRTKIKANDAFRMFNNNEVDCLLINQAGSTGASAHAIKTKTVHVVKYDSDGKPIIPKSLYPKDEVKQRVMIVLQAELNVNTEVQKRGRVNRTGQIFLPIYRYVTSAIPAEARLMMMLQKKLKSLDANTSSNQKESTSIIDVPDFLNKYGDKEVVDYLKENPEINKMIDDPLGLGENDEDAARMPDIADKAHKVSGRIAILSVKQQADFYSEMALRYNKAIQLLNDLGENDLLMDKMNLEAESINKQVKIVGTGGKSIFSRDTILEKCRVNNLKKPLKRAEVAELIRQALLDEDGKLQTASEVQDKLTTEMREFVKKRIEKEIEENAAHYKEVIEGITNERNYKKLPPENQQFYYNERVEQINEAHETSDRRIETTFKNRLSTLESLFSFFTIGKICQYPSSSYTQTNLSYKAVCLGISVTKGAKNPYAPSALTVAFAVASGIKHVSVPLSKTDLLNSIEVLTNREVSRYDNMYLLEQPDKDGNEPSNGWDAVIKEASAEKITQYIVTGNILQGYAKPEYRTGRLVSYTVNTGGTKKGILLPYGFDPNSNAGSGSGRTDTVLVPLLRALPVILSMRSGRTIDTNGHLAVLKTYGDDFIVSVALNRKLGGKYYEDTQLSAFSQEGVFNKAGDRMKMTVDNSRIKETLEYIAEKHSLNVELGENEFANLGIGATDYNDEEIFVPTGDEFLSKLQELDKKAEAERLLKAEQDAAAAAELAATTALEESDAQMREREEQLLAIKKQSAKEKVLRFINLLQSEVMRNGGSIKKYKEWDKIGEGDLVFWFGDIKHERFNEYRFIYNKTDRAITFGYDRASAKIEDKNSFMKDYRVFIDSSQFEQGGIMRNGGAVGKKSDTNRGMQHRTWDVAVRKTDSSPYEIINKEPLTNAEAEQIKKTLESGNEKYYEVKVTIDLPFKQGGELESKPEKGVYIVTYTNIPDTDGKEYEKEVYGRSEVDVRTHFSYLYPFTRKIVSVKKRMADGGSVDSTDAYSKVLLSHGFVITPDGKGVSALQFSNEQKNVTAFIDFKDEKLNIYDDKGILYRQSSMWSDAAMPKQLADFLKQEGFKKNKFEDGGSVDEFAQGGHILIIPEKDKFKTWWGRLNTHPEHGNRCVGSFDIRHNGKINDFYLYELNDFDKEFYNHIKVKQGEKLYRYETEATKIGKMFPMIKVNVEKGLIYFLADLYADDDVNIVFDTKGIKPQYLSICDTETQGFKDGGSTDGITTVFISNEHPLSTQLEKITGDKWSTQDYESVDGDNLTSSKPFKHKATGQVFVAELAPTNPLGHVPQRYANGGSFDDLDEYFSQMLIGYRAMHEDKSGKWLSANERIEMANEIAKDYGWNNSKRLAFIKYADESYGKFADGGTIPAETYVYKFYEERGEMTASVEDMNSGNTVWDFRYPDYSLPAEEQQMQSTPVDDGFMKHWEDVDGLREYLIDMEVIEEDATLLTEQQAQKNHDYYKKGGLMDDLMADDANNVPFVRTPEVAKKYKHAHIPNLTCTVIAETARGYKVSQTDGKKTKTAFYDLQDFSDSRNASGAFWIRVYDGGGMTTGKITWSLAEMTDIDKATVTDEGWTLKDFNELYERLKKDDSGTHWVKDTSVVGKYIANGDGTHTWMLYPNFHKIGEVIKFEKGGAVGGVVSSKEVVLKIGGTSWGNPDLLLNDNNTYEIIRGSGFFTDKEDNNMFNGNDAEMADVKARFKKLRDKLNSSKENLIKFLNEYYNIYLTTENRVVITRWAMKDCWLFLWNFKNEKCNGNYYLLNDIKDGEIQVSLVSSNPHKKSPTLFEQGGKVDAVNAIIEIEQIGESRKYKVYYNSKLVGEITNKSDYSDKSIDSLLIADAQNLVQKIVEKDKPNFTQTKFIGTTNHVKNYKDGGSLDKQENERELKQLQGTIKYSQDMIAEANEEWVKKEYRGVVEQAEKRISAINNLAEHTNSWVEFGDYGDDWQAWRMANYAYDRAYSGATIRELTNYIKDETNDVLPIDILIKVKEKLVPKGYVLTEDSAFTGKVYWHPYAPNKTNIVSREQHYANGGNVNKRYTLCKIDYKGATPSASFTFDAANMDEAESKASAWAHYHSMVYYKGRLDDNDVLVREANAEELKWTTHNEYMK